MRYTSHCALVCYPETQFKDITETVFADQGQDPVLHVERARVMFDRVQQTIDAGRGSEYTIQLLAALREHAQDIMDNLGPAPAAAPRQYTVSEIAANQQALDNEYQEA